MKLALLASLALGLGPIQEPNGVQTTLSSWVEIGPGGIPLVRAITNKTSCPFIQIDQATQPMKVRVAESAPNFPVTVCEIDIPEGTLKITLENKNIPLPHPNPQRILVLGDTGCRIKSSGGKTLIQNCNDTAEWPLQQIASAAAQWKPDLVIHVGDYNYRESPCPSDHPGCKGSPYGDLWDTWNEDFFNPAAPLLNAAPWIMVRGNHGWFRFLEPRPYTPDCKDLTDSYWIPIGNTDILVLDSAPADDNQVTEAARSIYSKQISDFLNIPTKNERWVITHRPSWGISSTKLHHNELKVTTANATLQAAWNGIFAPTGNGILSNSGIQLLLSGHVHLFELLSFADFRPLQLIVGTGGTQLDDKLVDQLEGIPVAGTTVSTSHHLNQFGFMTLERLGAAEWLAQQHSSTGEIKLTCRLRNGNLDSCFK